jgi:hypothetical protein
MPVAYMRLRRMTEPEQESPETESITAWHPMLLALLEFYKPGGWQILPEFLLSRMPQRVDIVVLRLMETVAGTPRKLHSVFDHLRPHTLIEHKGPTDDLEPWDALTLLAYAGQYMRLARVSDPEQVCLMVLCDRIPAGFVEQVERLDGAFAPIGAGLWRGRMAGLLLHGVETREACKASPTEHLLYTFSRAFLTNPHGLMPLDDEEWRVYTLLYQQVEQFRKKWGSLAMTDIEALERSLDQVFEEMMEQRLKRRLQALTSEELAGVPPEKRLAGLTPDQILAALPPETLEQLARKLRH